MQTMDRRAFIGRTAAGLAAMPLLSREGRAAEGGGDRPNVLFIMTDQQFGDAMSCVMGRQYLHTPAMDSLAARGMLFSRAYASNPLCMPLRNSLFTGFYPHETGVTQNKNVNLDPARFVSLGTHFRRAGYDAAYCGKWHLCYPQNDPDTHGFEVLRGAVSADPAAERKLGPDRACAGRAEEFLARKHGRPFLLVASFLNPHNICEYARGQNLNCGDVGEAPPPAQCPPVPANLAPPRNEPDGMTMMRRGYHATPMFPVGSFTPDQWRRHRWGYYRMIELVDAEIGRVLAALRKNGLEENTVVVFTSDHGECAGAHGFNQKTVLYEESARVPLIVTPVGNAKPGACDRLVNIGIDLLPTMADFAGIRLPEALPGRSLRPLAAGQTVAGWRDHVIVQNHMNQAGEVDGFRPEMQGRMVRSERYKYCVYTHGRRRESLVDLRQDPGETNDLATDPAHRDTLLQHRELLAKFARERNDALAAEILADGVAARPFA